MTKEPFTVGAALRRLSDAERLEGTEVFLPAPHAGHALAPGLVLRADGAMMRRDPLR
jgi:hypothetical protein